MNLQEQAIKKAVAYNILMPYLRADNDGNKKTFTEAVMAKPRTSRELKDMREFITQFGPDQVVSDMDQFMSDSNYGMFLQLMNDDFDTAVLDKGTVNFTAPLDIIVGEDEFGFSFTAKVPVSIKVSPTDPEGEGWKEVQAEDLYGQLEELFAAVTAIEGLKVYWKEVQ